MWQLYTNRDLFLISNDLYFIEVEIVVVVEPGHSHVSTKHCRLAVKPLNISGPALNVGAHSVRVCLSAVYFGYGFSNGDQDISKS